MSLRPLVVAFDVIETVFSLEKLRDRLPEIGLPGDVLEAWFNGILRDAFAVEMTGMYHPFRTIASAGLHGILASRGVRVPAANVSGFLDAFAELTPHSDAEPAFRRLTEANLRIVTLTNGSAEVTGKLLRSAGLDRYVEQQIAIDELAHWKPRREVYLHAAERVGIEPRQLALIAAHAWDIHGASCAGLTTAFVARGRPFPEYMRQPDITAADLGEAAGALAALDTRQDDGDGSR